MEWPVLFNPHHSLYFCDRWGSDCLRLTCWHARSTSGWGGPPATDVMSPDSGLLGLPILRRHRLCHLRRWHRVSVVDGCRHGAVRALHQEERWAAGHWEWRRKQRDEPLIEKQKRQKQQEFKDLVCCLKDFNPTLSDRGPTVPPVNLQTAWRLMLR